MKFFGNLFKSKPFVPLHKDTPETRRPQRIYKNFPSATNGDGWMLTKEQLQALLLVVDAMQQNSRGGFTWDEVGLAALDRLIEYGYIDSLKNPIQPIENPKPEK